MAFCSGRSFASRGRSESVPGAGPLPRQAGKGPTMQDPAIAAHQYGDTGTPDLGGKTEEDQRSRSRDRREQLRFRSMISLPAPALYTLNAAARRPRPARRRRPRRYGCSSVFCHRCRMKSRGRLHRRHVFRGRWAPPLAATLQRHVERPAPQGSASGRGEIVVSAIRPLGVVERTSVPVYRKAKIGQLVQCNSGAADMAWLSRSETVSASQHLRAGHQPPDAGPARLPVISVKVSVKRPAAPTRWRDQTIGGLSQRGKLCS